MDFALATEFSPSEFRYQPEYRHSDNGSPNLISIIQQLHESLDPRTVFACFGKIMGQHLPILGIKLHIKEYQLSWGSEQGLVIKQNVSLDGNNACLHYRLSSPMLTSQTELLYQLQGLLLRPLVNAIEYELMAQQAMYDALTQLGNRHYYTETIKQSLARAQRHGEALSLVVLDLDNFKLLNDRHGHLIGDDVLLSFAQTLNQAIRESDQAFRIGGDEFTVIIQGDVKAASIMCERVLNMIDNNLLLNKYQVQTSLGVAQWQNGDGAAELYLRADNALYSAKAAGRRCYRVGGLS